MSPRPGSNAPSARRRIVDEERMRPGGPMVRVSALCSLHCFSSDGWMVWKTFGRKTILLIPEVLFWNRRRKKTRRGPSDPGLPGKTAVKWNYRMPRNSFRQCRIQNFNWQEHYFLLALIFPFLPLLHFHHIISLLILTSVYLPSRPTRIPMGPEGTLWHVRAWPGWQMYFHILWGYNDASGNNFGWLWWQLIATRLLLEDSLIFS